MRLQINCTAEVEFLKTICSYWRSRSERTLHLVGAWNILFFILDDRSAPLPGNFLQKWHAGNNCFIPLICFSTASVRIVSAIWSQDFCSNHITKGLLTRIVSLTVIVVWIFIPFESVYYIDYLRFCWSFWSHYFLVRYPVLQVFLEWVLLQDNLHQESEPGEGSSSSVVTFNYSCLLQQLVAEGSSTLGTYYRTNPAN